MSTFRPFRFAVTALAALLAAAASAAPAAAADPSVGLVRATRHVTVFTQGARVPLDLGIWVAARGGNFELRVTRPDYDHAPSAAQVDAQTGAVLRSLPAEALDGWFGLKGFASVTFRNEAGTAVAWRAVTFCPGGWERQRIGDQGPPTSRYPALCFSAFPFMRGAVWGIEDGWAASALNNSSVSAARVPPGRYTVTARITPRYVNLFSIPVDEAQATVDVTVKAGQRDHGEFGPTTLRPGAPGAPALGVPLVTDPDPETLPDLVALPNWSLTTFHRGRRDFLGFAASPWNAGPGSLVVEGFRRPGEDVMDAFQYFRDAQGDVVGRAEVGDFRYDARRGHEHWHFLQFAAYSLLDGSGHVLVRSRKQAYCLAPTDAVDVTVPGASWTPWSFESGSSCGSGTALWVREELQPGWADTYFQGIPGQAFDITGLRNGWYQVRIEVNPLGLLYERTRANNVETRLVYLTGEPGARSVVAAPWHGIEM